MEKSGRFPAAIALAVGLIASTMVGARALVRIKSADQTISVTGSAKRRIKSDLVVWSAEVSSTSKDRSAAYKKLAGDVPKVTAWLARQGVPADKIKVHSIATVEQHPIDKEGHLTNDVVSGYVLKQSVEVRWSDVDRVERIAREATELLDEGVVIESGAPDFHYTKVASLKIEMLADASRDARVRAEQIASSTGSRIGPLRSARMGVMQINAADQTETDAEGMNDTSSIDKDVMAVVTSSFALE